MTTERDLLDAVAAVPDDDGPRLVFADWVEEHGDPERAEFIRLQIRLAGMDEYDPDFARLSKLEEGLIRDHGHRWKIPDLKGRQEFRRGFVDYVWIRGDRLAELAKTILSSKTVTSLRVSGADHHLDELARQPFLSRIRRLDLSNNSVPSRDRLLRFFDLAKLKSLTDLALRNNMLWPEQLAALAKHPTLPRLQFLDVSGNPLADEGMMIVSQEPCFSPLQTLIYRSNRLDISHAVHGSGASFLADSSVLTSLRHLDLDGHTIGDNGAIAFASTSLPSLEWLDLSDNDIGLADDHWATAFIPSDTLARLRVLRLRKNRFGRKARLILERWRSRRSGRILDLEARDRQQDLPR